MHKKKMRMWISFLLSFFLAAALFLVCGSAVIKAGFLPGNAWQSYLRGSGYGSRISEEAEAKLTELLEAHGLPAEAAGDLISQRALYTEYSLWAEEYWETETGERQNQKKSGGRKAFEEQLTEQIMDYLADYQANITGKLEQEIQAMAAEAGRIFENYLNPQWLQNMIDLEMKYQRILTGTAAAGIAAAALCIFLLWRLYHYKHRAVRFLCFALEASLAWSAGLLALLGQKEWIAQSGIGPPAYRELIEGLTDTGIQVGLLALGAEGMLLILLLIWMRHMKHSAQ